MTALTFQPNGDRIDALQVDGEPVGRITAYPGHYIARLYSPLRNAHTAALAVGTLATCQQAIVRAWAKRFPHA